VVSVETAAALGLLIASYITLFNLLRRSQFELSSLNRREQIGLAFNAAVLGAAIVSFMYFLLHPEVVISRISPSPIPLRKDQSGSAATAATDPRLIGILYSSDREFEDSAIGKIDRGAITSRRSPKSVYGSAVVRVPEAHSIGSIERPTDFTILGFRVRHTSEDEKKHFIIKSVEGLSREDFVSTIQESEPHGAMVFVHGFNTTFDEAIFRTAQLAYDTHFPGVPIAFCWPSKGEFIDYDYDRESALFSRDAFLELLHLIRVDASIDKLYVIAHSMGNQIVVDALAHAQDAGLNLKLSELIMAAPDVDSDVFKSLINRLVIGANGLTLYASAADRAMLASRIKAGGVYRAGDVPPDGPITAKGMETIDATTLGDDLLALNHSTFSSSRSLIDDIGRIMLTGTRPPDVRSPQLVRIPIGSSPPRYWKYPQ
jgi:esterase/lipase superfamily enzyme